jgi:uncharacterized membrane protein
VAVVAVALLTVKQMVVAQPVTFQTARQQMAATEPAKVAVVEVVSSAAPAAHRVVTGVVALTYSEPSGEVLVVQKAAARQPSELSALTQQLSTATSMLGMLQLRLQQSL